MLKIDLKYCLVTDSNLISFCETEASVLSCLARYFVFYLLLLAYFTTVLSC